MFVYRDDDIIECLNTEFIFGEYCFIEVFMNMSQK